jgi:hypothetical protein
MLDLEAEAGNEAPDGFRVWPQSLARSMQVSGVADVQTL